MEEQKRPAHEAAGDHDHPVPRLLLLAYLVIAAFFLYYLATGLRFGTQSPTGF